MSNVQMFNQAFYLGKAIIENNIIPTMKSVAQDFECTLEGIFTSNELPCGVITSVIKNNSDKFGVDLQIYNPNCPSSYFTYIIENNGCKRSATYQIGMPTILDLHELKLFLTKHFKSALDEISNFRDKNVNQQVDDKIKQFETEITDRICEQIEEQFEIKNVESNESDDETVDDNEVTNLKPSILLIRKLKESLPNSNINIKKNNSYVSITKSTIPKKILDDYEKEKYETEKKKIETENKIRDDFIKELEFATNEVIPIIVDLTESFSNKLKIHSMNIYSNIKRRVSERTLDVLNKLKYNRVFREKLNSKLDEIEMRYRFLYPKEDNSEYRFIVYHKDVDINKPKE